MDIIEMLKNLGQSLADYEIAENLKEIGLTLRKLGDDSKDPARSCAYHIAAVEVCTKALESMKEANAKLPKVEDEAE